MNLYSFFMRHFREKMRECKNVLVLECITVTPPHFSQQIIVKIQ